MTPYRSATSSTPPKTVKNYASSILFKLGVAWRVEAAPYLARRKTLPDSIE